MRGARGGSGGGGSGGGGGGEGVSTTAFFVFVFCFVFPCRVLAIPSCALLNPLDLSPVPSFENSVRA